MPPSGRFNRHLPAGWRLVFYRWHKYAVPAEKYKGSVSGFVERLAEIADFGL